MACTAFQVVIIIENASLIVLAISMTKVIVNMHIDMFIQLLSFLQDIKAASLRTLTSIIHLDRNPK